MVLGTLLWVSAFEQGLGQMDPEVFAFLSHSGVLWLTAIKSLNIPKFYLLVCARSFERGDMLNWMDISLNTLLLTFCLLTLFHAFPTVSTFAFYICESSTELFITVKWNSRASAQRCFPSDFSQTENNQRNLCHQHNQAGSCLVQGKKCNSTARL